MVSAFLFTKIICEVKLMEAVWFVLGFAVTTTVVLATEKVLEKI